LFHLHESAIQRDVAAAVRRSGIMKRATCHTSLVCHAPSPKLKYLWGKGPLNEWDGNIDALHKWGYIQPSLADELRGIFDTRCQYLHSAAINTPEQDARRCVVAAFAVLTEFVGFAERLFRIGSAIECLDTSHPLFEVFYKPAPSEAAVPAPAAG
jgi:hypothetical protein